MAGAGTSAQEPMEQWSTRPASTVLSDFHPDAGLVQLRLARLQLSPSRLTPGAPSTAVKMRAEGVRTRARRRCRPLQLAAARGRCRRRIEPLHTQRTSCRVRYQVHPCSRRHMMHATSMHSHSPCSNAGACAVTPTALLCMPRAPTTSLQPQLTTVRAT